MLALCLSLTAFALTACTEADVSEEQGILAFVFQESQERDDPFGGLQRLRVSGLTVTESDVQKIAEDYGAAAAYSYASAMGASKSVAKAGVIAAVESGAIGAGSAAAAENDDPYANVSHTYAYEHPNDPAGKGSRKTSTGRNYTYEYYNELTADGTLIIKSVRKYSDNDQTETVSVYYPDFDPNNWESSVPSKLVVESGGTSSEYGFTQMDQGKANQYYPVINGQPNADYANP